MALDNSTDKRNTPLVRLSFMNSSMRSIAILSSYLVSIGSSKFFSAGRAMANRIKPIDHTLMIGSTLDPASVNMVDAVLSRGKWQELAVTESSNIYSASTRNGERIFLWMVQQSLLTLNFADRVFIKTLITERSVNSSQGSVSGIPTTISNIVFLSRHQAASGTLSLTVHPVGIPWMAEAGDSGGVAGRCSPPSPHMSSLYRAILSLARSGAATRADTTQDMGADTTGEGQQGNTERQTKDTKSKDKDAVDQEQQKQQQQQPQQQHRFEVTLEATHHGPYVEVPACFVEIGSTPNEWGCPEAGAMWAECLLDYFAIPYEESPIIETHTGAGSDADADAVDASASSVGGNAPTATFADVGVAVVNIGGGHYVPKMNDMVSRVNQHSTHWCLV